ncbi:MAG: hypothetical protein WAZ27_01355 [Minisyncoccia bacterium]
MKTSDNMKEVIPTIVPNSFDEISSFVSAYPFASSIHLDAADGAFAPNITWMPEEGEMLPNADSLFYEAHLMVSEPASVGLRYAHAGAKRIIAHIEAFTHPADVPHAVAAWKAAGADEVGLAITIDTPLEDLTPYVPLLDCLLIMTIAKIGTQGNIFDVRGIERLETLHGRFPGLILQADGGITEENAADVARAGATRLCVGSALSHAENPAAVYKHLGSLIHGI